MAARREADLRHPEAALRLDRQVRAEHRRQGAAACHALAYVTFFTESAAAICLAIGLFTRAAAVMIWIEMAVIIAVFLWPNGYFWTNRGFEYALLWLLLCTAIFF